MRSTKYNVGSLLAAKEAARLGDFKPAQSLPQPGARNVAAVRAMKAFNPDVARSRGALTHRRVGHRGR